MTKLSQGEKNKRKGGDHEISKTTYQLNNTIKHRNVLQSILIGGVHALECLKNSCLIFTIKKRTSLNIQLINY